MTAAANPDWRAARLALLEKEKALSRLRDELAAERRALPRVRLDKPYVFTAPSGEVGMADLFAGKTQLLVYHFMLGPTSAEPCKSCSFWAEHFDAVRVHLAQRGVELVAVSRAPLAKIQDLQARFGWRFPWYSSLDSDFNFDFAVSFTAQQDGQMLYNFGTQKASAGDQPGLSAFLKDDAGVVYHTYSTYGRGIDALNGTYQMLDVAPLGRNEEGLAWPMAWVRHKDRY